METVNIQIKHQEKQYNFTLIKGITYYIYFDKENKYLYKSKIKIQNNEIIKILKP